MAGNPQNVAGPGELHHAPKQWKPGTSGGPPKEDDSSDSEGESGDEVQKIKPHTFADVPVPSGYGSATPVGQMMTLPPPPPPAPSGSAPDMQFGDISKMDEGACRDAMIQFVSENCCYGKSPAREMTFSSVEPKTALHYTLETFAEKRSTGYKAVPYRGGPVDGPQNGPPPPPWAIPCDPSGLFNDQVKLLEVPHTSFVQPCYGCSGKGWIKCGRCKGKGRVKCRSCHGGGKVEHMDAEGNVVQLDCPQCHKGKSTCHKCSGEGRLRCKVCDGYSMLKAYIELKVEYKNHKNDYIMEKTDMPDELVRTVGGKPIFEQTLPQVWPIVAYPVREVNENSTSLCNLHTKSFNDERKIMQRQVLRAVPVTEVIWSWKEDYKNKKFWVYGNEHKVYCPDYPQQCCWGCNVL